VGVEERKVAFICSAPGIRKKRGQHKKSHPSGPEREEVQWKRSGDWGEKIGTHTISTEKKRKEWNPRTTWEAAKIVGVLRGEGIQGKKKSYEQGRELSGKRVSKNAGGANPRRGRKKERL